jgi:putative SOS response-associated peptidase YedK
MPVILHPDAYDLWLDKDISNPEQLQLLYPPYPADLMTLYPVATLVNSPRNDNLTCIEPVPWWHHGSGPPSLMPYFHQKSPS